MKYREWKEKEKERQLEFERILTEAGVPPELSNFLKTDLGFLLKQVGIQKSSTIFY